MKNRALRNKRGIEEMPLVKVKGKAQITLPARIRKALGIEEGDYLEAGVEGNKVVLIPQAEKLETVELSKQGEQMLKEGLEDITQGKTKAFEDVEALIADLHK